MINTAQALGPRKGGAALPAGTGGDDTEHRQRRNKYVSQMVELHDIDVPAFLKVLDSCEGEVY